MTNKKRTVLALFITMFKIGLFTFGGGYAMIALLENEFVNRKKWLTKEEFLDMTAIVGSAPGSIAVNASTFIGYKLAGVWGSVSATVAVCTPSFIIIYVISLFLKQFLSYSVVAYAFRGIQICVIYLILSASIRMFLSLKRDIFTMAVFGVTVAVNILLSLMSISFSSVIYILSGGFLGLMAYLFLKLRRREE